MATVLSVNLAVPRPNPAKDLPLTGIDKRPVAGPAAVRAPGPRRGGLGSGLIGDHIGDTRHHGGDDQAVYAYAREDYDWWQAELGQPLDAGTFGENLTTLGIDVNGAVIGEVWRVGPDLVLQTTFGRIPCATFQARMARRGWIRRFTREARPGAYLRVVAPGEVRAGDEVTVVERPAHGMTIAQGFRAVTLEPQLLARLADVPEAPDSVRAKARAWVVSH